MQNRKSSPGANGPAAPKARRSTALSHLRPSRVAACRAYEAAMYIGISAGKFDEMVADGKMPEPVKIDSRKLWDIRSLDLAFDALPRENETKGSSWDDR